MESKKKSSEMCGVNAPKYKETRELGSAFGASSSLWGVAVAEEQGFRKNQIGSGSKLVQDPP